MPEPQQMLHREAGAARLVDGRGAAIVLALAAVVLLTCGELWQSASGWTLSYELADPDRRTAYLSTFQLGASLQTIIAPWLITTVLFPAQAGWLFFAAVMLAAATLLRIAGTTGRP